ncbi:Auxin response factor 19, partial [Cucurbita argyrosperma subsp. sororia]
MGGSYKPSIEGLPNNVVYVHLRLSPPQFRGLLVICKMGMKAPPNGFLPNSGEGERKNINSELWHACAGPLVSLPPVGSLVVYFPQGHSEQDYSMQPPAQELVARDLHDNSWTFRHIYRGQPKRHLLTTGWSVFVSTKRLFAGDSVLFISDMDSVRWKNSQWRNLQVGWDESAAGERPNRVSIWEVEPVVTPFYICPPPFFRPKFPKQPGMPDDESEIENAFKRAMPWFGDEFGMKDASSSIFPGLSLVQWMSMQHNNQFPAAQSGILPSMVAPSALHGTLTNDESSKLLSFQAPLMSSPNLQFSKANQQNQVAQLPPTTWSQQQQVQQLLQVPASQQLQQQQQQQLPLQQELQQQTLQQPLVYSQLQQQQLLAGNIQSHQTSQPSNKNLFQTTSLSQEVQFQPQIEQQPSLLPKHQQPTQVQQAPLQLMQQSLSQRAQQQPQVQQFSQPVPTEQQLQLQLLQKLQQQQQHPLLSPASPLLPPQLLQQQNVHQQNQQLPPLPLSNQQQFILVEAAYKQKNITAMAFQV